MDAKLNRLIKDLDTKRDSWNERSQFKIKGVGNLSSSDLDTIEMYAENGLTKNGDVESGLMPLRGSVRKVFVAYGILD